MTLYCCHFLSFIGLYIFILCLDSIYSWDNMVVQSRGKHPRIIFLRTQSDLGRKKGNLGVIPEIKLKTNKAQTHGM